MFKYALWAVLSASVMYSTIATAFEDFTEADLDFVDMQFKSDVVQQLNWMAKNIEACTRGIGVPYQDKASENPANPEFSVSCGNMANRSEKPVLYFFSWMDAVNKKDPHTKGSISYKDAAKQCRDRAYASVKNSNSARLTGIVFRPNQDGSAALAATLKAKNDFGLFVENEVRCHFTGSKLTKFEVF